MTRFLLFLVLCPFTLFAQSDTLKLIGSDLLPANHWNGNYWQSGTKVQYTYDGLDVRAKDLGLYILASGDADAIREYNAYIGRRRTGGWLIAGGILGMVIGTPIMLSNRPGSDGKFTKQQPYVCPSGYACGSSVTGKMVYGGQIAGYETVTDTKRAKANAIGFMTLLGGGILTTVGWSMNLPGKHLRRSVQYYNRALKERGVSWQLTPYSSVGNSGVYVVGRF